MITLLPYLFRNASYLDSEAINRNLRAMGFAFADIAQRRYEYFTLHIPLDGLDSTMTAAQRTVRIPVAPSSIALPFDIISVGMFAVSSANVTLTLQAVHDATQFDSVDAVANQEATAGLDFVVINTGTAKEFRIDFSGIATLTSGYLLVLCRSDRFRNNSAPSDITWLPSYLNAATTPNAASLTSQLFVLDGKITQNDSANYQNDVAVLGFGLVGLPRHRLHRRYKHARYIFPHVGCVCVHSSYMLKVLRVQRLPQHCATLRV